MSSELKHKNYVGEAEKLLDIIDETKVKQRDYGFFLNMKGAVKNNTFVGEKAIFWLRDIKDRQME